MPESGVHAASRELIEELMGAVVAVDFVLRTLMDMPEDVLPGENRVEAIRELLTASACQEVETVGAEACRAATALIGKVIDRIADDAHATAELAGAAGQQPC
ncbi:MAG TPA: hypothetical protein VFZ41_01330 [Solirubrobacterales bacterium]